MPARWAHKLRRLDYVVFNLQRRDNLHRSRADQAMIESERLRTEIAERYGEPYAQLAEMLNEIRAWAQEIVDVVKEHLG